MKYFFIILIFFSTPSAFSEDIDTSTYDLKLRYALKLIRIKTWMPKNQREDQVFRKIRKEQIDLFEEAIKVRQLISLSTQMNFSADQWHTFFQTFIDLAQRTVASLVPDEARVLIIEGLRELQESLNIDLSQFNGELNMKAATIEVDTAPEICYYIMSPGDIMLRKSFGNDPETRENRDFGPTTLGLIDLLENLKFQKNELLYRHAEIITSLPSPFNISTIGYYPWAFNLSQIEDEKKPLFFEINIKYPYYQLYRNNFSVYRIKSSNWPRQVFKRELALYRTDHYYLYPRLGVCSDFVNWAYFHDITDDWNQIPVVKHLMQIVYLPEGIQTPDNLANSPQTQKICEIHFGKLIYPQRVVLKDLVDMNRAALGSSRPEIYQHAQKTLDFLEKNGVIDQQYRPLFDTMTLKKNDFFL